MTITSHNADGSVLHQNKAIAKQKAGKDFAPNVWHVWLCSGKRITNFANKLDRDFSGWRDLPEKP